MIQSAEAKHDCNLIYKSTGEEFCHHEDDCFSGGVWSWSKVGWKWYACGPL